MVRGESGETQGVRQRHIEWLNAIFQQRFDQIPRNTLQLQSAHRVLDPDFHDARYRQHQFRGISLESAAQW